MFGNSKESFLFITAKFFLLQSCFLVGYVLKKESKKKMATRKSQLVSNRVTWERVFIANSARGKTLVNAIMT